MFQQFVPSFPKLNNRSLSSSKLKFKVYDSMKSSIRHESPTKSLKYPSLSHFKSHISYPRPQSKDIKPDAKHTPNPSYQKNLKFGNVYKKLRKVNHSYLYPSKCLNFLIHIQTFMALYIKFISRPGPSSINRCFIESLDSGFKFVGRVFEVIGIVFFV
jgi:hypothetical protein